MHACESLDMSLQICGHMEVELTNDIKWKEIPGVCIMEEANGAISAYSFSSRHVLMCTAAIPLAHMAASAIGNVSLIDQAIGVRVDIKSQP